MTYFRFCNYQSNTYTVLFINKTWAILLNRLFSSSDHKNRLQKKK